MTPDQQAPFVAQQKQALAQYDADIRAFNARIPLSRLVEQTDNGYPYYHYIDWSTNIYSFNRLDWSNLECMRNRGAQIWNRYRRDHPLACGGAVTPVPDQPFRFIGLPQELRTMIYHLLLCRPRPLVQMQTNGSAYDYDSETDEGPVDVRLFAVCKQIYEEATDVLLGQNVIKIDLGADLPPPMFREGTQSTLIPKLRRIGIYLPLYRRAQAARVKSLLERTCQLLASESQLTGLGIIPFSPASWYNPNMHEAMDGVLEALTILRGVSRVIIPEQEDLVMMMPESAARDDVALGTQAQKERIRGIVGARLEEEPDP